MKKVIKKCIAAAGAFVIILQLVPTVMAETEKMPMFRYEPDSLEGIRDIGGEGLPELSKTASASAPALGEVSQSVYPDETLAIVGDGLDGAVLNIWSEGELRKVEPLRSDNTKMQVTVPADMKKSTMLIWPERDGDIGAPLRVNYPIVWWWDREDMYAGVAGQEISFCGQGLYIEGNEPKAYVKYDNGEMERLEITEQSPYKIKAVLPGDLPVGRQCSFYLHNGTGGNYGWSEPCAITVIEKNYKEEAELPVIKAEDYGATAGAGDDSAAIKMAVSRAKELGGAVIEFGPGEYNISEPIDISGTYENGIILKGAAMGEYDLASRLEADEIEHRGISIDGTVIRFSEPALMPDYMILCKADNAVIKDMTLIGADYGNKSQYNLWIKGKNITVDHVRMIKIDARDLNPSDAASFGIAGNMMIDNNSRAIAIKECEFHTQAAAISIFYNQGIYGWGEFSDEYRIKNVKIDGCNFYGYATGTYQRAQALGKNLMAGESSAAVRASGCENVSIENCIMQGYDKEHAKTLTRTLYVAQGGRKFYAANNIDKNVGKHPSSNADGNTGEQWLFHGGDAPGIFNISYASDTKVTLRKDNIKLYDYGGNAINAGTTFDVSGSKIPRGMPLGSYYYAYIISGKGAGQYRAVTSTNEKGTEVDLTVDKPWNIVPDETSIICIISMFTNNIIYNNKIVNDEKVLAMDHKSGGVLFYYSAADNIVANNNFKNVVFGVGTDFRFKMPALWLNFRDNKLSGMRELEKNACQGGDTTTNATFMFEVGGSNAGESGPYDDCNALYTVGNAFRGNECSDGDVAAELAVNRWHRLRGVGLDDWYSKDGSDKGATMTILENNTFTDVSEGINVGNSAFWTLVRNNKFNSWVDKEGYKHEEIVYEHPKSNFRLLYIKDNAVFGDVNETLNPRLDIKRELEENGIRMFINGVEVVFDDANPMIKNDRVLVPARLVFEKLGAEVSWLGYTNEVIIKSDGKEIKLTIASRNALVNGEYKTLDCEAELVSNRTMIPIRFVAESLGADVAWDEAEQTVYINTQNEV